MEKIKEKDNKKDAKEVVEKKVKNMKAEVAKKEVVSASNRKWENIDDMR